MIVFHPIFSTYTWPPLSYLRGKKLRSMKELTLIQTMNSVSLNKKNVVNNVGIFNKNDIINNDSNKYTGMNNVSCKYSCDG